MTNQRSATNHKKTDINTECPVCEARRLAAIKRREELKLILVWTEIILIISGIIVHIWF